MSTRTHPGQEGTGASLSTLKRWTRYGRRLAARVPLLQSALLVRRRRRFRDHPWMKSHPFDRENGTETAGYLPPWIISAGATNEHHSNGYAGCQPSCLRAALAAMPDPSGSAFVDLGCGKGRALILASEHPFAEIIGIELSPLLVENARSNAAIAAARRPGRPSISVRHGDAIIADLPRRDCVLFLYHSFGRELVRRLIDHLVAHAAGREIFFIYENPVHGDLFDATAGFERFFARNVVCDPAEWGFAPDPDETVVVWRRGGPPRSARPGADRPIVITQPDARAILAR